MKTTTAEQKQKRIEQSIAKANAIYRKATPEQRRVLIAKHALHELRSERVKAVCGHYVLAGKLAKTLTSDIGEYVPLQPALHNPASPSCSACARGSLLLSAIWFRNRCNVNGSGILDRSDKIVREFPARQQKAIEVAFEMWRSKWVVGFQEAKRAEHWWRTYLYPSERLDSKKRLAVILRNIIRNKGEFVMTER